MKVSINKRDVNTILHQGNIIEFEFGDKRIMGIYTGHDQTGHTVILLNHPAFTPGTIMTYSFMDNVKLFAGTVTLSND